jgi:hypothetical protein
MEYDSAFSDIVAADFEARVKTDSKTGQFLSDLAQYRFTIEPDFAEPPVKLIAKWMNQRSSGRSDDDLEDLVFHYCVLGRAIEVYLDDRKLEGIMVNSLDTSWDAFGVFRAHPIAFNIVKNAALFYIIKKFMPPLRQKAPATVGAVATPDQKS